MEICLFYSIFVIILFKELTMSYLEIRCASFMMSYHQMLVFVWLWLYTYLLCTWLHVCLNVKEDGEKLLFIWYNKFSLTGCVAYIQAM